MTTISILRNFTQNITIDEMLELRNIVSKNEYDEIIKNSWIEFYTLEIKNGEMCIHFEKFLTTFSKEYSYKYKLFTEIPKTIYKLLEDNIVNIVKLKSIINIKLIFPKCVEELYVDTSHEYINYDIQHIVKLHITKLSDRFDFINTCEKLEYLTIDYINYDKYYVIEFLLTLYNKCDNITIYTPNLNILHNIIKIHTKFNVRVLDDSIYLYKDTSNILVKSCRI
jgi:hypothetical protein